MTYPNGGFTKFPNDLRNKPWLQKPKTVAVYFWLRMNANHFHAEWRGIKLSPGEICASQERIERETGLTRQEVRTALGHLKKSGCVVVKACKPQPTAQPENQPTVSPTKQPIKISIFSFTDKGNWGGSEDGSTNLLSKGSTNDPTKGTTTDREIETDKELEKDTPTRINKCAPTCDEVISFFEQSKIQGDPVSFWAHYASIGWMLSGSPILDWRYLAYKWERNGIDDGY